jgi:hypothetical protein
MRYSHARRWQQMFTRPAVAAVAVVVLCVLAGSVWLKAVEPEVGRASSQNVTARLFADVSSAPESFYLVLFGTSLAVLGRFFARRPNDPDKREVSRPSD